MSCAPQCPGARALLHRLVPLVRRARCVLVPRAAASTATTLAHPRSWSRCGSPPSHGTGVLGASQCGRLGRSAHVHTAAAARRSDATKPTTQSEQETARGDGAVNKAGTAHGQVLVAQANFMRVLVDPTALSAEQREVIEHQVANARAAAAEAQLPCSVPEGRDPDSAVVLLCNVRALLKKMQQQVLVGDLVQLVGVDWVAERGMIEEVLPRSSELENPRIANVDTILLVFALDNPPLEPYQVSRFLISAEAAAMPFSIVLNKVDLVDEDAKREIRGALQAWGYQPTFFSVATGEGLGEVAALLKDKVAVIAGPSGVGKSSLINRLHLAADQDMAREAQDLFSSSSVGEGDGEGDGDGKNDGNGIGGGGGAEASAEAGSVDWGMFDTDIDILGGGGGGAGKNALATSMKIDVQSVGSVSQRTGRGRHTTRHVTLLQLPTYGLLADTPGFNQPALEKLALASVPDCFPEIRARLAGHVDEHADVADGVEGSCEEQQSDGGEAEAAAHAPAKCTFSNCTHRDEPGCVVRGDWERYSYYLDLYGEVEARETKERRKVKRSSTRKAEDHVRVKSGARGTQRVEAKLSVKKHRRTNRRLVNMQDFTAGMDEDDDDDADLGEDPWGSTSDEDEGDEEGASGDGGAVIAEAEAPR